MPTLPSNLRRQLERTVKAARIEAEAALREAFARLGLTEETPPAHLGEPERALRRHLRAHNRRLGGTTGDIGKLVEQAAYLRWHRLLFVRFLDARGLLRHPEGDVLTLADCAELAVSEGASDGWSLAARYSSVLLPQVFAQDDPTLGVVLAPEREAALRRHIGDLPAEVYLASDSLGWTYQYWRAAEKDAVNASGVKIGADELPAVTQLFTEPYMVRFLLDNTLGAWWAAKAMAADPTLKQLGDEPALRAALALDGADWAWLRFVKEDDGWRPAAGGFPGWPREARAITVMDPCCGSGHFLTEALPILVALRSTEEGLGADVAVAAVLRDNIHGLEIDGRCVQIASFAVALTAWQVGGFQHLPNPQIAWVGAPPPLPRAEFEALGNGDAELRRSLNALYDLFRQAPLLGSLIEVSGGDLVARANLDGVEAAMARLAERTLASDPERTEGAIAAGGMAEAAALLARKWVLQITNVPYLGEKKQDAELKRYVGQNFANGKPDLATAMLIRAIRGAIGEGTVAAVTPQNWLFLTSYEKLREEILATSSMNMVVGLGSRAFEAISGEVVNAALITLTSVKPTKETAAAGIDVNDSSDPLAKSVALANADVRLISQSSQRANPDCRIGTSPSIGGKLLAEFAISKRGIVSGDSERWYRKFWEPAFDRQNGWRYLQSTVSQSAYWHGKEHVVDWSKAGEGMLRPGTENEGYGQRGIVVSLMSNLLTTLSDGSLYDNNSGFLVPLQSNNLPALWCFATSNLFLSSVRQIDRKMNVTNATLLKVPFDLSHWTAVAAERYPNGLPEPYSNDPTQWLFHGHPVQAEPGTQLHVALARLAGYRWPAESDPDMRLSGAAREWIALAATLPAGDDDGLLPLEACSGERPLAERLRGFLAAAYGAEWSADLEAELVEQADAKLSGSKKTLRNTLEDWLANRAFAQHVKLFNDRPFLWHVWDGRSDGFSAFVHYHRLDRRALEKLTYTLINDWIARADDSGKAETARALQARLTRVLEGEDPYDIFVRWKPLKLQPLGWNPDVNDGVRMNIRPFVTADVLRAPVNVHWRKDRGSDGASAPWFSLYKGDRVNEHHTKLAEKMAARGPA